MAELLLKDRIVHLRSVLFPSVNVFCALHTNISVNPHILTQRLSSIVVDKRSDSDNNNDNVNGTSSNETHDHYAIMDASRITSLEHLAIAVNAALLRASGQAKAINGNNDSNSAAGTSHQIMGQKRGRALDTIVCAGGSTNVASVLKDFAFNEHSIAAEEAKTETKSDYNVVLIGIDVTLEQYADLTMNVNIGLTNSEQHQPEMIEDMIAFFGRERSKEEVTQLIKVFKTTREEVNMQGLEKAIINRVASKFYI
jgi:hypothetical protein